MRLSRLALAFVPLVIACGGGTESSAPPPIDVPARDAGTGNSGPPSLTVTIEGDGTGVVTSAPAGIECPGKCNQSYARDERVTLTATPGADSVFTGWSGGGCSGFAECTATIGGPVTVVAKFAKKLNVVVVSKSGTGTGTVSSTPGGIACGATCSAGFAAGSNITLTAAADTGSTFTGWAGGGCTGTDPVCQLAIPAATEVITTDVVANFVRSGHALTVTKNGTGSGTVTSTQGFINCGATCSATIEAGTMVTLTATPAMGSTFTGWSGACAGTGTCSVTMTAARNVTATFGTSGGALTCSTVNTASSCTNAQINEINLGALNGATCHDQCQVKLGEAGVTTGCWVVASNTNCYCRGGVLNLGGGQPGGSCSN